MNKKYISISIAVVVIIGGGIFLSQRRSNTASNTASNSASNKLYPEQTVTHAHGLAVDAADPNKLYIATHEGLFVLMNDTDLFRVGKSQDDYMGFSAHPTDSNTFFSSGHPGGGGSNIGFQKSKDGGFTWKKIADGVGGPVDFHALAINPVNPNLVYGWFQGNIQRSTDQGKTWEIVNRDVLAVYLAADSEDENTVYAASPRGQGVLVSRDGGRSWTSLSQALEGGAISVIAIQPKNAQILLTFSEQLGGLGKSADGGKTWHKTNESFNGEAILYIAFDSNNPPIAYALSHKNSLYKSVDAGDTWNKIR